MFQPILINVNEKNKYYSDVKKVVMSFVELTY